MINETVAQTLLQSGMIMEAGEHIIDLTNFSTSQIIAEALEEFGLIVEGDEENEERFRQAMAAKEKAGRFGDPRKQKAEQNLVRAMMSGHFLILSGNRQSLPDEPPPPPVEKGDDPEVTRQKQAAIADYRQRLSAKNRKAWWSLRRAFIGMGFKPILATGLYQEKGMDAPATEPSIVVSPVVANAEKSPDLSKDIAERLSKAYNQDGFVYAGPETGGSVILYEKDHGGVYVEEKRLGQAKGMTIEEIQAKLKEPGMEKEGVGGTQVTAPSENPDRRGFGRQFDPRREIMAMSKEKSDAG